MLTAAGQLVPPATVNPRAVWVVPIVDSAFVVLAAADAVRRRLTWGFLFPLQQSRRLLDGDGRRLGTAPLLRSRACRAWFVGFQVSFLVLLVALRLITGADGLYLP